jgi:uncharacterized DUF497 family protein
MKPWDERKNRRNQRDHGISFETAWLVFDDKFAVTAEDYKDANGEMRYQTIGLVRGVVLTVAHVYRVINAVETPWLVMATKAVKYETNFYYSHHSKN